MGVRPLDAGALYVLDCVAGQIRAAMKEIAGGKFRLPINSR